MNKFRTKLIIPLILVFIVYVFSGCVINESYIKVVKPTEREKVLIDMATPDGDDVFTPYEFKVDKNYKKLQIISDVYHNGKLMKNLGTSFECSLKLKDSNKGLIGMSMVNWNIKLTCSNFGSTIKKLSLPKDFLKNYNKDGQSSYAYETSSQKIKENKPAYLSAVYLKKDDKGHFSVIEPNSLMKDNIKELKNYEYCIVTYAIFLK